jgi:hypothetical protein
MGRNCSKYTAYRDNKLAVRWWFCSRPLSQRMGECDCAVGRPHSCATGVLDSALAPSVGSYSSAAAVASWATRTETRPITGTPRLDVFTFAP